MNEIVRMVVVLSLIAGICSAVLTMANQGLSPRIEQQTDYYVRGPALERLFQRPAEEVLANKVVIESGDKKIPVFYVKEDGKVTTLAIEATAKGHAGDLQFMIGIDLAKGQQTGMEVVSHSETPGLGARIEEEAFRRQWQGLPLDSEVSLSANGGEIDAISGATNTSIGAVNGTNQVLSFLQQNKDKILNSIAERKEQS